RSTRLATERGRRHASATPILGVTGGLAARPRSSARIVERGRKRPTRERRDGCVVVGARGARACRAGPGAHDAVAGARPAGSGVRGGRGARGAGRDRPPADWRLAMTEHAVLIAGGGPTGLMLAGELALAGVDVAIVERRPDQELAGSRAGGLHSRTIEGLDQRGDAARVLPAGQVHKALHLPVPLDISDLPTRHNYVLGLFQNHIERILAGWINDLAVPIYRGREVTGFGQDGTGVDVELSDGDSLRAEYLVGCDGGRSLIRKTAGIEFPGWDPTTSWLIAEVETSEEPEWGFRHDAFGTHAIGRLEDGRRMRVALTEQQVGPASE